MSIAIIFKKIYFIDILQTFKYILRIITGILFVIAKAWHQIKCPSKGTEQETDFPYNGILHTPKKKQEKLHSLACKAGTCVDNLGYAKKNLWKASEETRIVATYKKSTTGKSQEKYF